LLLKDLNHPEARVRRLAMYALTHCGPAAKSAVPALRQALQDADPQVREAAGRALGEIDPQAAKK
jgi:HEAT repeat protein